MSGEKIVISLSRLHLVLSLAVLLGSAVVWPAVFYVKTNAAIDELMSSDVAIRAALAAHDTRINVLDRSGTSAGLAKIEAQKGAIISLVKTDTDHEARIRLMEKAFTDMAADLRWLVNEKKAMGR